MRWPDFWKKIVLLEFCTSALLISGWPSQHRVLSAPPALPEEQEPDETELLPDPDPVKESQDSLSPEKRNAVSDP